MDFIVLLVLAAFPLLVQSDAPLVCDPKTQRTPVIETIDDLRNDALEELNAGRAVNIAPKNSKYKVDVKKSTQSHLLDLKSIIKNDGTERKIYFEATIKPENIVGGTSTDSEIRKWNRMIGAPCDDAGHLIANELGGPGNEKWNIWPQNAGMNRGKFSKLEQVIRGKLYMHRDKAGVYALLRIYFNYNDQQRYATRPTSVYFEYTVQRVKLDQYGRAVLENEKPKIINLYHSEACEMINENDCNNCFDFKRSVDFCQAFQSSPFNELNGQVAEFCAAYL